MLAAGKYQGLEIVAVEPTNSEVATPKHKPGSTIGNNTPNDIPTRAAFTDRT
jgi:hypothetical protein